MKKFLIKAAFMLNVGDVTKAFEAGEYETKDEAEIKALTGSKGAKLVTGSIEPPKAKEAQPEPDSEPDTELLQLQAEYEAKLGKKPHHKAGKDKLKALIADYDNQQKD
ncbi:conserved hypothetical protein [Vibrio phage 137E35-1]|nr:conserved hypothetical protein [Vibrio phage 137E35-1]CAH9015463.1 conserved hypothetical protein [Vibrio phage 230E39-1]